MTPWQKIMRAYSAPGGVRGCRLTADDVLALGQDSAIETTASYDDEMDCEKRRHIYRRGDLYCVRCGSKKGRK